MVFSSVVQNAADLHLGRIEFVLLPTRYIRLNFSMNRTKLIKLATTAIQGKAIYILDMYASAIRWFFG